ncbi:MAG: hypothetical protein ACRCYU_22310 [Nocardioides sp.]
MPGHEPQQRTRRPITSQDPRPQAAGRGFNPQHPIPHVLPAEPPTPPWVSDTRRAENDDGLIGVDWINRPSTEFADQVVQSLLVRPDGRVELNPPVVFTGEVPEIVQAEDWLAYAVLAANIAGILGMAQEATRTITRPTAK